MNNIATIWTEDRLNFERVRYYSVLLEGQEECEFARFWKRMEEIRGLDDELNDMYVWLTLIGNKYGARKDFFREERHAQALPPINRIAKIGPVPGALRLYCLRLSDTVVILFNGGIKTKREALDCPNVGPQLRLADKIATEIISMVTKGEIKLKEKKLIFKPETEIEFGG